MLPTRKFEKLDGQPYVVFGISNDLFAVRAAVMLCPRIDEAVVLFTGVTSACFPIMSAVLHIKKTLYSRRTGDARNIPSTEPEQTGHKRVGQPRTKTEEQVWAICAP
jgi:hypothetical protein